MGIIFIFFTSDLSCQQKRISLKNNCRYCVKLNINYQMKKWILRLLLLLVLGGGGYFAYQWFFTKSETVDAFKLIPQDAVFVVQTDEPIEGWNTFSKSEMWQHIKQFPALGEIGKMADELSRTIEDNKLVFSAFGHRNVLISAHLISSTDYDFLYVCDMKETAKFGSVKDGIVTLIKRFGYAYTQTKVGEIDAHHFFDPKDKSTLHMAFVANQLVCSYNASIFKNALAMDSSKGFNQNELFNEVASATSGDGLCRMYLNHNRIPAFLGVYMDDITGLKGLFNSMHYTGASADLNDELIQFKGYTSINDSMASHLRALHRSGKSKTMAQDVLSTKTAFMLSMGFQSFAKFYENLKDVMKEDAKSWEEFNKSKKKIETLLRFKLEEDLMGWIDDEVTLARYQQDRVVGSEIHTLVAIKALSEEKAKDKLGKLEKRLKLLGKFKTETYKGHEIHYIEIRGLFKLLFGKLFDKIEKPYYTYINGFVVFCDDPGSLLQTIDDFENKSTLAENTEFKDFHSGFKNENTVLAYVNMKKYFLNLKGILDAESYQTSYQNRQYIICFPQMGFQMTQDDKLFDTRFRVQFRKPNEFDLEITEGKALSQEELEELDSMSDADIFILEYINGSVRKELYDNGKVKILAEMKNGQLHGKYIEYYENGSLKVKGRYREGEKSGKWLFYKEDGDIDHKEKFRKGSDST